MTKQVPTYSTSEGTINLPEYGRNIQRMVDHAISIPDKEERQRCANHIINIMGNLFPHLRNIDDFKHKLWDHLAIISDFKLDIDYPYPIEGRIVTEQKKEGISYQKNRIRFPQYGFYIEKMVQAILDETDYDKQQELIILTLYQMKKIYLTWNRDNVEDQTIIQDLQYITRNNVNIPNLEIRVEMPKNNNNTSNNNNSKRKNKH